MLRNKIVFLVVFIFSQFVYAETSPVPMLESSANNIINTLKHNQSSLKTDKTIVNKAIRTHLLPHVDVVGMSRSVLGRQIWTKISNNEKRDFTDAFTKLVIRTYAVPLAEYSGETVKFMPVRSALNNKFVQVNSVISRPNGQKIPLKYSLVAKGNSWMIYDLSVDGVSLLQSFRTQFNDTLKNISMQELIKKMNDNKNQV